MQEVSTIVTEFPYSLLPLLRCSRDAGQLVTSERRAGAIGLIDGSLRCMKYSQEYSVENGIARLMTNSLTPEDEHEISLKTLEYESMPDAFEALPIDTGWRSEYADQIEIPPHLEGLEPLDGAKVLEVGCGDGRFTLLMAQMGAEVLAVDFSIGGLRKLTSRLSTGVAPTTYRLPARYTAKPLIGRVGLVQADASDFRVAPRSFDRALSATPLDSRDERMRMYRTISESLTDDGRYIGGVEYDDLRRRILGLPLVRRYTPDGILIEHLNTATMRREAAPYFSRLRFRPIRPQVPFFLRWMSLKQKVSVARLISATPLLRQLGEILLLRAERPIRLPDEGAQRPGSALARKLYLKYKRSKKEEPDPDLSV